MVRCLNLGMTLSSSLGSRDTHTNSEPVSQWLSSLIVLKGQKVILINTRGCMWCQWSNLVHANNALHPFELPSPLNFIHLTLGGLCLFLVLWRNPVVLRVNSCSLCAQRPLQKDSGDYLGVLRIESGPMMCKSSTLSAMWSLQLLILIWRLW